MSAPEPPADLIQMRRDFLAAEKNHTDLCHETVPDQEHDETHQARVREAFAVMRDLAVAISGHAWWAEPGTGNRTDAEKTLRKTADAVAA